jgi:hypothetical protein
LVEKYIEEVKKFRKTVVGKSYQAVKISLIDSSNRIEISTLLTFHYEQLRM